MALGRLAMSVLIGVFVLALILTPQLLAPDAALAQVGCANISGGIGCQCFLYEETYGCANIICVSDCNCAADLYPPPGGGGCVT